MRRWAVILAVAAPLSFAAYAAGSSNFVAIDRCLDAAGAWNYRTNRCEAVPSVIVDHIYVSKSQHWMAVYQGGQIVREFRVALGRGGLKPKEREGDGRVPEGLYRISAHNPESAYHLSLRIDYPTPEQSAQAAARGLKAGGDIMIHGLPNGRGWVGSRHLRVDWTEGCIALTDSEMGWLYRAVPDGTPIEIRA